MKQYIIDAFTDKIFAGNPAAVCILEKWLSEKLMLNIAKENNLSETAFAVKEGQHYYLRWFTPGREIDLCGHATLAAAFVILNFYETDQNQVIFDTLSGTLVVNRRADLLEMTFPSYELKKIPVTAAMADALGVKPVEAYLGRDLLCILESEEQVKTLLPDQNKLKELDGLLQHVTAKGKEFDCVSRSFAPKLAVAEDPVCGSGHCHIIPYWAERLGKSDLVAYQASARTGILYCHYQGQNTILAGKAVLFAQSDINL